MQSTHFLQIIWGFKRFDFVFNYRLLEYEYGSFQFSSGFKKNYPYSVSLSRSPIQNLVQGCVLHFLKLTSLFLKVLRKESKFHYIFCM